MLEQRRAKQKGYITLKEAALMSNYSADYIGQLIRAGKIKGEQVYSNVAWVTTPEEIEAYLRDKNRSVTDRQSILTLAYQGWFRYFLVVVIGVLTCAALVLQYILYVSIDRYLVREVKSDTSIVEIIPAEKLPVSLVYE